MLGKSNSLWYYHVSKGHFRGKEVFSSGYAYSAPSLVIRSNAQATGSDPAGEVDIAVEASSHALYFVHSPRHGTSWQNAVVGPSTTYSTPSLAVFSAPHLTRGEAYIAVEGPQRSLVTFNDSKGWTGAGTTCWPGTAAGCTPRHRWCRTPRTPPGPSSSPIRDRQARWA